MLYIVFTFVLQFVAKQFRAAVRAKRYHHVICYLVSTHFLAAAVPYYRLGGSVIVQPVKVVQIHFARALDDTYSQWLQNALQHFV